MLEPTPYAKERQWRQDVRDFAGAVKNHWKELVGSSVVAVAVGAFAAAGLDVPKTIAGIAAFSFGVIVACFLAWRDERQKAAKSVAIVQAELVGSQERLRPKITTACGEHVPGTRETTRDFTTPTTAALKLHVKCLRLAVTSLSDAPLKQCHPHIVKVEKDGKTICADKVPLCFEPPGDSDSQAKTIAPRSTEYVNVVTFTDFGPRFGMYSDVKPSFNDLIKVPGEYLLTAQITSTAPIPTETTELKFTYTGQWETSRLEKL